MSRVLSEDVVIPLKELINEISGFQEGSEEFKHVLKYFKTKLIKSDTMYFLNKREVDQNINSMSEKFCFHGFFKQADALKIAYKTYFPEHLLKNEIMSRLNVVKFLLCMSESPTNYFLQHPELFVKRHVECKEKIDWGAYLNEGMDQWGPSYYESSDNDSYASLDDPDGNEAQSSNYSDCLLPIQIKSSEKLCIIDFKTNREELLATIQHSWYNQEQFCMEPQSQWREANIGILWEKYLQEQVHGLILLKSPSFISEYNVIREILWQLWHPVTSSTFEFSGNCLRPRPDITLASIRSYAFYTFMGEFISYIEILEYFRDFERSLHQDLNICRTYQSYCTCINTLLDPIYKKLCQVEVEVRQQETTYTLLKLADELNSIFQPIKILKEIHDQMVIDHKINDTLTCATKLIVGLHESLNFTASKQEQDLKLTLFLGTLYHYLGLLDSWLIKDDLIDYSGEFVIEKEITLDRWHTQFVPKNAIDESCKKNSFIKIFIENILKIGKNINFLRLLGKYDIIGDCQDSIYNEFIQETFKKLNKFNNLEKFDEVEKLHEESSDSINFLNEENFIFPVVGTEVCKTNPQMQKLENLVDIEDKFLVTAFAEFFVNKSQVEPIEEVSLYERISKTTTNLFPKANLFESILINIIESRFTVSGLMVKKLLIEEHLLEKQFDFLKHLYLFFDDMIFPFYRRLFLQTETSYKSWANDIWLTSYLHDIFMDMYPEFYEKCSVQVQKNWALCTDSLSACSMINFNYEMTWPLNVIIKQEQIELYKDIFQFLLKIKWALHSINHLAFSDLTEEKSNRKSQKTFQATAHKNKPTAKLIRLKFSLINILNSLQHFIFGFVLVTNLQKFELNFEKAYDLNSLIESHSKFINSVGETIADLKWRMLEKDKDNNILNCIKSLKLMWKDQRYATAERISDCNKMYQTIFSNINPVIFPEYIYDY